MFCSVTFKVDFYLFPRLFLFLQDLKFLVDVFNDAGNCLKYFHTNFLPTFDLTQIKKRNFICNVFCDLYNKEIFNQKCMTISLYKL